MYLKLWSNIIIVKLGGGYNAAAKSGENPIV